MLHDAGITLRQLSGYCAEAVIHITPDVAEPYDIPYWEAYVTRVTLKVGGPR